MEQIIIVILLFTSVVGLTFIVERGLALRWKKVIPTEIETALESCRRREDIKELTRACEAHPSPMGRLLLAAAEHMDWPRQENVDSLQTRARHELSGLERGLVVLEIIVGIAPLLGLVGTILGMITLFSTMGDVGLGDNTRFAKGIALALNATLLGLIVAIPSLVAWSYYSRKVERMAVEMETLCDEFLRCQYRLAETKP